MAACNRSFVYGVRSVNVLDDAVPIRKDSRRPVNHQIGDRRVEQQLAQFLGKERQNQFDSSSRSLPWLLPCLFERDAGSTETRFSWNSVMVNPSGLMNSYCG